MVLRTLSRSLLTVAIMSSTIPCAADEPSRSPSGPSTAFFYGKDVPPELLAHFDRIVVEPDHAATAPSSPRAEPFAYVAVGEVHRSRVWYPEIPSGLFVARNTKWGSDVVDTRSPRWTTFLLDRVIEPLWTKGYRGFFLDALDSYERYFVDAQSRDLHARQIGALVGAIKRRHPAAKILLNRGFDVLPHAPKVDGLVVESMFSRCDVAGVACQPTPAVETKALLERLRDVQVRWRLPITVVDYAPMKERALRRTIARRIIDLGFEPWVATPKLDDVGVGRVEIVPRRVLLLYRSNAEGSLATHDASVLVAPILEWLGYAVDYVDVKRALPAGKLAGRYAGIVTLLPEGVGSRAADGSSGAYRAWLLEQMAAGIRVAFVEGFGFDPDAAFLAKLGLAPAPLTAKGPMRVSATSSYFGFEAPVRPRLRDRPPVQVSRADVRSLLRLQDADDGVWDGAVIGDWGGAAFMPYVLEERLEQERRFVLDPFTFLQDALALPPIPAPDVTTEGGRRILTAHVDGDAFVSRAERLGAPFTAEIMLDEILTRWRLPHTVSIVEGEVGPTGMYPHLSASLEKHARRIFALPHVEMASHTYSHPFEWEDAEAGLREPKLPHLAIRGYRFDLEREIAGSVAYINSLAPPGKRVKVLLWSGNCSPSARAVALSQKLGLFNVNGGGATRTRDLPSLTRGSAMGIPKSDGVYQVFAPVENENVYTNDWLGPFDGYRHAIETFQLDDAPRRLRTITIYYHFYSAAKTASLRALEKVYAWATTQETTPLYLSEYAAKVLAFQRATLARRLDGGDARTTWELGELGELRTMRLSPALGAPDLSRSIGVAGVREVSQGTYAHLTDERDRGVAVLSLVRGASPASASSGPRLVQANGRARKWRVREGSRASLRVAGNVPLDLEVAAPAPCVLTTNGQRIVGAARSAARELVTRFRLSTDDTGEATVECR
ncbi:MAG: endo alpha-1,4 polygalactosaminidase [Labilithrix sp.]|nr:endo alpha-1,4 polygalactosaminidase [Labilithrix sp.]